MSKSQLVRAVATVAICVGLFGCNKTSKTETKADKAATTEKAAKPTLKNPTITPVPTPKPVVQKTAQTPKVAPKATPAAKVAPTLASPALMNPALAKLTAPAAYTVRMETTRGDIFLKVNRDWAPRAADRFFNLVKAGYYTDIAFFRVIKGFMAQVGMNGDPKVNAAWQGARMKDDPVRKSNIRGTVSFASAGPNSRTTQFFINFNNNKRLDKMGFAPFGAIEGRSMSTIDALFSGYGEGAPRGRGPSQSLLAKQGNRYLRAQFPKLDYIKRISVASVSGGAATQARPTATAGAQANRAQPAARPVATATAMSGPAKATLRAPAKFSVVLETTKGDISIEMQRAYAPIGVDRFYNLVKMGYYTDVAFFRVIKGFMAQVGISGNPALNKAWEKSNMRDDPITQSNKRGWVTFATRGKNTRTTQFFINFSDKNSFLDRQGFSPIGRVAPASMPVVDALYSGYGEGAPRGKGPSQGKLRAEGNSYLRKAFPQLDYIKRARIAQ
jgi:peptidyl-prolyl cis-trans isomerase A (cyclophilin A)